MSFQNKRVCTYVFFLKYSHGHEFALAAKFNFTALTQSGRMEEGGNLGIATLRVF